MGKDIFCPSPIYVQGEMRLLVEVLTRGGGCKSKLTKHRLLSMYIAAVPRDHFHFYKKVGGLMWGQKSFLGGQSPVCPPRRTVTAKCVYVVTRLFELVIKRLVIYFSLTWKYG